MGKIQKNSNQHLQLHSQMYIYQITEAFVTLIVEHHQCLEAYQQQEHQDFPKLLPLSSSREHSLPDTKGEKAALRT
jgi:hypothetical protein